jgi:Tfp pilus assembly protein PilX
MSPGATVAVVIAVLVVLALLALFLRMRIRRRHLQERFGPEYDRQLQESENRRQAEKDLANRERRYDELDIRPLEPAKREQYAADWQRVQERFVDTPDSAVADADRLVILVMRERGYPTEGYEQQVNDLSVAHARTLEQYRAAHDINSRTGGDATTEDMRQAMVHYRAVVTDLLGTDDDHIRGNHAPPDDTRFDDDTRSGQVLPNQARSDEDDRQADRRAQHRGGPTDATR